MQQVISRPGQQTPPGGKGRPQPQKLLITVLTLFAFSGLLIGFTVGAYTRTPNKVQPPTTNNNSSTVASQAATPTPTAGIDVATRGVGCPIINQSTDTETADGNTSYTFTVQAVDKSIDKGGPGNPCGKGQPLFAQDLMCKIWLTKDAASLKKGLPADSLKPANLSNSLFPGEEANALIFDGGTTPQVQQCSQTGLTSWSYKLSPNLKSGTYYLAAISDWHGTFYNWRWTSIAVKNPQESN